MTTPRYSVGDEVIAVALDGGHLPTKMVVTHVGEPEYEGDLMRYTLVAETAPPEPIRWSGTVTEIHGEARS